MATRTGRYSLITLTLLLQGLFLFATLWFSAPQETIAGITHQVVVHQPSLSDLADASDLIVRGQIVSTVAHWTETRSAIVTDVTIAPLYVLRGDAPSPFTFQVDGGELPAEDIAMGSNLGVRFAEGEHVVLFLRATDRGFTLADAHAAKFTVGDTLVVDAARHTQRPLTEMYDELATGSGVMLPDNWETLEQAANPQLPVHVSDYVPNGYKWFGDSPVVEYYVNLNTTQAGGNDGSADDFLRAVTAAADTWSLVPSADFALRYAGPTQDTQMGFNGTNAVIFTTDLPSNVLGQARYWYSTSTGRILEADIAVNDTFDLDTTGNPDPHEIDLQSVIVHEFGHWLSLGHDDNVDAIMTAYLGPGVVKRTLHANDSAGISSIYPCPLQSCVPDWLAATPTPTPTLTPTATPSPTPTTPPSPTPGSGDNWGTIPPLPEIGTAVHPDVETVIETDTQGGGHVELCIEPGSVRETIHVVTDAVEAQVQAPNMRFTGVSIGIHAIISGTLMPEYVMDRAAELTIHYDSVSLAAAGSEPDLYLYRYIPALDDWSEASCGEYVRDPANNTLIVDVCILGDYALMAADMPDGPEDPGDDDPETPTVFLPIAARP